VTLTGILVIIGLVLFVGLVHAVVGQVHESVVDGFHRVRVSFTSKFKKYKKISGIIKCGSNI